MPQLGRGTEQVGMPSSWGPESESRDHPEVSAQPHEAHWVAPIPASPLVWGITGSGHLAHVCRMFIDRRANPF